MAKKSITTFPGGVFHGEEVTKSSAYTVVINTDAGKTFETEVAMTFTLPGIAIGNTFTFVYTGVDGAAALTISPNASDGISYIGSATDNKDLILTAATAKRGDFVTIASLDQAIAWQVTGSRGVWALTKKGQKTTEVNKENVKS